MFHTRDSMPIMLNDDDEWRGTTDPGVRRRVQNRLNQRAYRQRRRGMRGTSDNAPKRASTKAAAQCLNQTVTNHIGSDRTEADILSCQRKAEDRGIFTGRLNGCDRKFDDRRFDDKLRFVADTRTDSSPWYTDPAAVVLQFQELKLGRHIGRSPSNDHLLCIMQFNVMRAFGTISSIIGLSPAHLIDDGASSPFSLHKSSLGIMPHVRLPNSLAPTALQRSISHHPWFDILPFPQMRDNLLRQEFDTGTVGKHQYDADSLCHWMVGLDTSQKESGLILWGDPWDLASWEVTAEFFHKWGWTLEGCVDVFRSTNYWRAKRGEKPLFATGMW
ncbi:hypothetical protein V8C42DRAFT_312353 [Trichoderma barbatum]